MSWAVIYELLGLSDTALYMTFTHLVEEDYINAFAIVRGEKDIEVSDILLGKGFEPYFWGEYSNGYVLYGGFKNETEMYDVMFDAFEEMSREAPETIVRTIYRAISIDGKKYKDIEYWFYAKDKNKWKSFLYEVRPYAKTI